MSDIKPLNWTAKTLALISQLSLGLPSTVHIGSNEMLSYRVGRSLCRHSLTFNAVHSCRRTLRGNARCPHFSLAIISVTVQLWIQVFWVISVQFNIRNTLPKFGPFLLWHPVYPVTNTRAFQKNTPIPFSRLQEIVGSMLFRRIAIFLTYNKLSHLRGL